MNRNPKDNRSKNTLKNLSKSVGGVNLPRGALCYNQRMKLTARYKERFKRKAGEIQGKSIGFRTDEVTIPGGGIRTREYITHPGAVGVLAFESPTKILLVKQYRYPVAEFHL